MSQTTTSRKPCPVTHGVCKLLHWPHEVPEALDCGACILNIRPTKGRWADYWVRRLKDGERVTGYQLERIVGHAEERADVYDIDCTAREWVCDCGDATYRQHECKHVRALRECLKKAGLIEEKAAAVVAAGV